MVAIFLIEPLKSCDIRRIAGVYQMNNSIVSLTFNVALVASKRGYRLMNVADRKQRSKSGQLSRFTSLVHAAMQLKSAYFLGNQFVARYIMQTCRTGCVPVNHNQNCRETWSKLTRLSINH